MGKAILEHWCQQLALRAFNFFRVEILFINRKIVTARRAGQLHVFKCRRR